MLFSITAWICSLFPAVIFEIVQHASFLIPFLGLDRSANKQGRFRVREQYGYPSTGNLPRNLPRGNLQGNFPGGPQRGNIGPGNRPQGFPAGGIAGNIGPSGRRLCALYHLRRHPGASCPLPRGGLCSL